MSEPKQYNISGLHPHIIEDKNGFMIYYEDYASLKAENEELHKDYEALADEHTKLIDRNARLKAEVERLRKAGDDLVLSVEWRNVVVNIPPTMSLIELMSFLEVSEKCKCNLHNFDDDIKAWNAAKHGKPSV